MGTLNVVQLNYVAVMCEAALYGAFSLLILVVIWALLTSKKMPVIHMVMFGASISMWIISTIHLALLIQRLTFGKTTLWEAKGAVSLATLGLLIGDCILIWRVYAVWGRNWWVTVIPAILMIAAAAVRFAVVGNGEEVLLFASDTSNYIIIANTVYCTALISGRIWYISRTASKVPSIHDATIRKSNVYEGIFLLIIETGLLYVLSLIIGTIVNKVHILSPGIHVILDITMPWTGILPTLIILAVHFKFVPGIRHGGESTDPAPTMETLGTFHAAGQAQTISDSDITGSETVSRKEASTLNLNDEDKKSNRSMV